MHHLLATAVLALSLSGATVARADEPSWQSEREEFIDRRRALMIGLTGWGVANVVGGTALLVADPPWASRDPASRSFRRGFGAMALLYGALNCALATGTLATLPSFRRSLDGPTELHRQKRASADVFVANVGLDMFYVLVGSGLWTRGPSPLSRGVGSGIVVQSAPLFAFDLAGSELYRR
ncbi:MAG: hypothetical protein WKG00_11125 [Polyangiaceae bacterium]